MNRKLLKDIGLLYVALRMNPSVKERCALINRASKAIWKEVILAFPYQKQGIEATGILEGDITEDARHPNALETALGYFVSIRVQDVPSVGASTNEGLTLIATREGESGSVARENKEKRSPASGAEASELSAYQKSDRTAGALAERSDVDHKKALQSMLVRVREEEWQCCMLPASGADGRKIQAHH